MMPYSLVGSVVIRTKQIPAFEYGFDSGFTWTPIKIVGEKDGVVYYKDKPGAKTQVLSARYHDENWSAIAPEFMAEVWGTEEIK